jgi:hypothetical protein
MGNDSRYVPKISDCSIFNFSKFYLKGNGMKNLIKFVLIAAIVSLISNAAYAKKDNVGKKADNKCQKAEAAASKQTEDAAKEVKECKGKAEEKAEKAGKKCQDKVKDANTTGETKKSEPKKPCAFALGKDHQQQLKALDERAARVDVKSKEKIAALEKELAAANASNDTKKAEKLEKKLTRVKQKAEDEMKNIEAKRAKIKAEMEKEK